MKVKIFIILFFVSFLLGCGGNSTKEVRDTPTTGTIQIVADEAFHNLTENLVTIFHENYKEAHLNVKYVPESQAFNHLVKDSARAIIIGRNLTAEETKYFNDIKYRIKITRLALDGIAVIVHPSNSIDRLDLNQLKLLMEGKMNKFPNGNNIDVVLDNQGSGIWSYLRDSILKGAEQSDKIYALKSHQEVVDYVANNKNSIGFIDVNLISKFDDEQNQSFNEKVKPLPLAKNEREKAYEPYQAYIALKNYPLIRPVNLVIKEPYNGLGSGFGAFAASNKGQLVILNEGLVPSTQPIRLVEINTQPLGQ